MASTQPVAPVGRRNRRIERDTWVPALGPGMVLGAIGTIGLVVAMFMSWRSPAVHPSGIPFAFLFDSGTTADDPSILAISARHIILVTELESLGVVEEENPAVALTPPTP